MGFLLCLFGLANIPTGVLDVLIEGVLLAEHSRPTPEADVLMFPKPVRSPW